MLEPQLSQSCCINKNCYPEFSHNMVIKHPALIIDSNILQYIIIFDADYLDKCGFPQKNYKVALHFYVDFCHTLLIYLFCHTVPGIKSFNGFHIQAVYQIAFILIEILYEVFHLWIPTTYHQIWWVLAFGFKPFFNSFVFFQFKQVVIFMDKYLHHQLILNL